MVSQECWMAFQCVRAATRIEVSLAWPGATPQSLVEIHRRNWSLWQFDALVDLATINVQHPTGLTQGVPATFSAWLCWANAVGNAAGTISLASYRHALSTLRTNGSAAWPPIICDDAVVGWSKQVLDGKHRLFAAYTYMHSRALTVDVFWNQPCLPADPLASIVGPTA